MKDQSFVREDEVSLKEFIAKFLAYFIFIRRNWLWIVIITMFGAVAGLIYSAYGKHTVYTAEIKFLVDGQSKQAESNPLAALGLASVAPASGGGGDIFESLGASYIMGSAPLLERALLSKMRYDDKDDYVINLFIKYRQTDKNIFGKAPYIGQKLYDGKRDSLDEAQNQFLRAVIADVGKNLKIESTDGTGLISAKFKASDERFPKYFLEKLIEKTSELYTFTKTARTTRNIQVLQHQADSIRREMSSNIESVAYSADVDPNSVRPNIVRTSFQKKQVDNSVLQSTYSTLASSLVTTKIELGKQTPYIQVYERPIFPLAMTSGSGKIMMMAKFGGVSLVLAIVMLSALYFIRQINTYIKSL